MINILSNVKNALDGRRGSNSDNEDTLSPEYSQNQMNTLSSTHSRETTTSTLYDQSAQQALTVNSSAIPCLQDRARADDYAYQKDDTTQSSSSLDLKSPSDAPTPTPKSKKELKSEQKAAEQEELSRLAAQARERGETMKLDDMYLPNEFKNRGLAMNARVLPFGGK
ncbi:hypothetical protein I302_109142 [Kwoniella bestiolae CBS 10118]|uniref:Uncharacterized protein n=1 Tax=Kwoniella bestiolae CBS 10118 TaxID=1296100 RepID=A0A1B9FV40_9TREE|nr:hypothetical protein I302_08288 [Kwoniella bestiolae CBS 10118]OCF22637.1 hypothetical protein I302_08288 [Kwoniella bestiolae CBS 10118]